jgi:uncharacterized protein YeaO (DUF488 family)
MKTKAKPTESIRIKRAYEEPRRGDGRRILVERLWPRGLRKEAAQIDVWLKDIAPSTELRQWYAHDVERWPEFKKRYGAELRANPDAVDRLLSLVREGPATFIYAAHDEAHNSAVVLRAFLGRRLRRSP